ncbi:MAG: discoidin domain-containing protein [Verrucomicrobia bacterium]|nr:discoidin domain-containing protein [Verrucomicrobiota bacterium]
MPRAIVGLLAVAAALSPVSAWPLQIPRSSLDQISASSDSPESNAAGARDGDRFAGSPRQSWQGATGASKWWWQIRFAQPQRLGAILQIAGDHDFVFRHAPRRYVWQTSLDGEHWSDVTETSTPREQRCFRIHRLAKPRRCLFARIQIDEAAGDFPTLREVEFYSTTTARIDFPDWIVAVNTTDKPELPGHGQEFIPLARGCAGESNLQAQQVWLGTFDESFVSAEPRPLCAFLSGNFKDWCEVARESWRGTQKILQRGNLPMWASCGGAQGLAILAETGVDKPWDCPHCRDPKSPRTPIYTHIGHTATRPCGDYSACIFERGPHRVLKTRADPAFAGLPGEFTVMESHCGQIEWAPSGWTLIATAGRGSQTRTQCLRVKGRPIYAAQFHIEMAGTPDVSRQIMNNFLGLARQWNRGN